MRVFLLSLCIAIATCSVRDAQAQGPDSQAWVDVTLGRNFAAVYMAEVEVGYQELLQGSPQWSTFSITPTLEASYTPHFDVISGFPWMDTQQDDDTRTREFRVQLGARYHVFPFSKVQPRITGRYEWRHFNTIEPEHSTSQSNRTRLNTAVFIAWDKPRMSYDTVWYSFAEYEAFFVLDEQVHERYAHRGIGRIGMGRKFSYNWRLELVYALWHTRDEINEDRADQSVDNVYRLSLKYYITPPDRRTPKPPGS